MNLIAYIFVACEVVSNLLLWKAYKNLPKNGRLLANYEIVALVASYFLSIVSGCMLANHALM